MDETREEPQKDLALLRKAIRKEAAQELLNAMENSGEAVQPGLWFGATILDPDIG